MNFHKLFNCTYNSITSHYFTSQFIQPDSKVNAKSIENKKEKTKQLFILINFNHLINWNKSPSTLFATT